MSYFGWKLTAKRNRIEGDIGMNGVRGQSLEIERSHRFLYKWH
jgi:hypothetical protein